MKVNKVKVKVKVKVGLCCRIGALRHEKGVALPFYRQSVPNIGLSEKPVTGNSSCY